MGVAGCADDCRRGVLDLVRQLTEKEVKDVQKCLAEDWETLSDGFTPDESSSSEASQLRLEPCPRCGRALPVVKRVLVSEAWFLPESAVCRRLRQGAPRVALGLVVPGRTTMGKRPSESIRSRLQGVMWHVYDVALVDVEEGRLGALVPRSDWAVGEPVEGFAERVEAMAAALREARRLGQIPRATSTETEKAVHQALLPVLSDFEGGPRLPGEPKTYDAFWSGRKWDLLYRERGARRRMGIEVKTQEDWEHPLGHPVCYLGAFDCMVTVRVPPGGDSPVRKHGQKPREHVTRAEHMLAATGRAAFIYVWAEETVVIPPLRVPAPSNPG